MKRSPLEVFRAFGEGMMSGTDAWKAVLSDDIQFTGPVDQVRGLAAFSKLNEGFMPMIRGNQMKQVQEAGNYVITQIVMDVAMPSGTTIQLYMCEWYEIKDGKIHSIKVYYDAEEFRKHSS